jgi:NhaA family Na+:H+ antiporter
LTGIGFTMSLFIASLAYSPAMLDAAKVGILGASVVAAAGGLVALGWLMRRKRNS